MVANIYVINLVDNIKLPSLIYARILFSFRNIFKDFRVFVEYIIYFNQICKGTFQLHVYFEYVIQKLVLPLDFGHRRNARIIS